MAEHKLSIIIPFAGEYPQVLFTIRSIAESLIGRLRFDFEIIAVDNWCEEIEKQALKNMRLVLRSSDLTNGLTPEAMLEITDRAWPKVTLKNKSGPAIEAVAGRHPWLKYVRYTDRLSHWQAKRRGIDAADGDIFMFIDAHCIPSANAIADMYCAYIGDHDINPSDPDYEDMLPPEYYKMGSMHLPLTYKIMEYRRLIYKMVVEGSYHYYKFTGLPANNGIFEVPVMSTCGMMISRQIYDAIGGWPKGLGIYGGGENFMNYTLAVCGYKKFIFPNGLLTHHGERRDYHYLGDDQVFNRALAHYLFGGEELMRRYIEASVKNDNFRDVMAQGVIASGKEQRQRIKSITKVDLQEWINGWQEGN